MWRAGACSPAEAPRRGEWPGPTDDGAVCSAYEDSGRGGSWRSAGMAAVLNASVALGDALGISSGRGCWCRQGRRHHFYERGYRLRGE